MCKSENIMRLRQPYHGAFDPVGGRKRSGPLTNTGGRDQDSATHGSYMKKYNRTSKVVLLMALGLRNTVSRTVRLNKPGYGVYLEVFCWTDDPAGIGV